jgi:hypothetical protein
LKGVERVAERYFRSVTITEVIVEEDREPKQ